MLTNFIELIQVQIKNKVKHACFFVLKMDKLYAQEY